MDAPVQGALYGDKLELRCANDFTAKVLDKPDVLEIVARKASAILSRPVRVEIIDMTAKPAGNPKLEQLMQFGQAHRDIVKFR